MRMLLVSIVAVMVFAAGVIGCQCCDTGRQSVPDAVTSQPSVVTQRIAVGMRMSVVESRLQSIGASGFIKIWPRWAWGHGSGPSIPPPTTAYHGIFYRLPGDTIVWLLASKPYNGSDEQFVLKIIGLAEEGKADKFKQNTLGIITHELLKSYPKALTVSREGLAGVVFPEKPYVRFDSNGWSNRPQ